MVERRRIVKVLSSCLCWSTLRSQDSYTHQSSFNLTSDMNSLQEETIKQTHMHNSSQWSKQTPEHYKSGIYNLACNTCHRSYIGHRSRSLKLRFQEHTRYTKHNGHQSSYALLVLNNKDECDPSMIPWLYHNTSPNHRYSYHTSRCTPSSFTITISLSRNNTQMNKIPCMN
jgi:hypothetical protein